MADVPACPPCLLCAEGQAQGFVQYWVSTLPNGLHPQPCHAFLLCFCVSSFARVILAFGLAFGLIFILSMFRRAGVWGFSIALPTLLPWEQGERWLCSGCHPPLQYRIPTSYTFVKTATPSLHSTSSCFKHVQPVFETQVPSPKCPSPFTSLDPLSKGCSADGHSWTGIVPWEVQWGKMSILWAQKDRQRKDTLS